MLNTYQLNQVTLNSIGISLIDAHREKMAIELSDSQTFRVVLEDN